MVGEFEGRASMLLQYATLNLFGTWLERGEFPCFSD
ncbi:hypothetical protein BCh11DRAFT_01571 [Burkholderia sp. Ch1-1]|uniref:Uncharacterized protein n=1 Tax=Paraburkholderia dioscoreae TaxID=2604047 RepID=A0A5Q4ZHL0_9BURK|nr:hypothetical protein BCh11DRAFT_01571 [Burkholderia sp. Ch1-1]VVD32683.1 conserved protein of unknown function [Paraburkholderia dioscoreae]